MIASARSARRSATFRPTQALLMEALKANRGFRGTKGATLSVDPETKRFELSQYAVLEDLDPDRLVAMVEDFATTLTTVRGKLNGIVSASTCSNSRNTSIIVKESNDFTKFLDSCEDSLCVVQECAIL